MNEREAFLRAICENPDDDNLRLVFADWLQENGEEAWAEFIRVQISLARMSVDDSARQLLEQREVVLSKQCEAWVRQDFTCPPQGWRFARGFIDTVLIEVKGNKVLKAQLALRDVLRNTPTRHLLICDPGPNDLESNFITTCILESPVSLQTLEIWSESSGESFKGDVETDFDNLFRSSAVKKLESLTLSRPIRRIGLGTLVTNSPAGLTHLDLGGLSLRPEDLDQLVPSNLMDRLESLYLGASISDEYAMEFFRRLKKYSRLLTLGVCFHTGAAVGRELLGEWANGQPQKVWLGTGVRGEDYRRVCEELAAQFGSVLGPRPHESPTVPICRWSPRR